jgi:hypothetical protein
MSIYVANDNGDWWEFKPGQTLYVLDTEKMAMGDLDEMIEEYGGGEIEQAFNHTGVAEMITYYGKPLPFAPLAVEQVQDVIEFIETRKLGIEHNLIDIGDLSERIHNAGWRDGDDAAREDYGHQQGQLALISEIAAALGVDL